MAISQLYAGGSGCSHDQPTPTIRAINLKPWQNIITQVTNDLFKGSLQPKDLHKGLTALTYKELDTAASSGYGISYKKETTGKRIDGHLYRFSAAKTYHQLKEMQGFLIDEKGNFRSLSEFKSKVNVVHKKYNQTYLETEYQTAKRSAQAAKQWHAYQEDKDLFPNLTYKTVGDARVRKEHEKLDQITKPIDDVFWDTYYPPNDWGCRCGVKSSTGAVTNTGKLPAIAPAFKSNVGKNGQVFAEDGHPYFTMPKDAAKNYKKHIKDAGK